MNVTKDTYMPGKDTCILDVIIEMYTYIILEQYCSRVGLSKTKKQNKNKKHTTKPNTGTILLIARILEYFLTKNNLYHNHALLNYSKIYM